MASAAASYREDVEHARVRLRSFARRKRRDRGYRKSCGGRRSWRGRHGITATARVLGMDQPSLQKWTIDRASRLHKVAEAPRRHRLDGSAAPVFNGTVGFLARIY